jgi:hypothetical protein
LSRKTERRGKKQEKKEKWAEMQDTKNTNNPAKPRTIIRKEKNRRAVACGAHPGYNSFTEYTPEAVVGIRFSGYRRKGFIMRQIALFTTDWNYELVGETLRGVSAYLRLHPEVNVRVFDCFSIDEEDLEDLSLYEIYQLADLDQYDGAIVQTHQIVVEDVARRLERRLKAKGIPSVTVGVPLGEMPQVRSNDH